MGEMADEAIDRLLDLDDKWCKDYNRDPWMLDEEGNKIFSPFSGFKSGSSSLKKKVVVKKPIGPGPCPICGSETHEVFGKFGIFYGCNKYPDCKGNRDAK